MTRQQASAYDSVRDEDVRITCDHADTPHDFDVERAVQNDDKYDGGTPSTAKEHPRLLSADLSHDPVEACQGTITRIVDGECGRCGYDRATLTVKTLAGEQKLTCRRCGSSRDRDGWSPPTLDRDRVDKLKQFAETDGPLELLGHLDPPSSRYDAGTSPIYGYSDGTTLYKYVENGSVGSISHSDLYQLTTTVAECGQFSDRECEQLIHDLVTSEQFDVDTFDKLERLMLMAVFKPDGVEIAVRGDEAGDDTSSGET